MPVEEEATGGGGLQPIPQQRITAAGDVAALIRRWGSVEKAEGR